MIPKVPKYRIVLRYLEQKQGVRKVKLYPEHRLEFGMYEDKLHHVLYTEQEDMWCVSDMPLNEFIRLCDQLSDVEITSMVGTIVLSYPQRKE